MEECIVGLGERQYPIRIGSDVVEKLGPQVRGAVPRADSIMVISDERVAELHAEAVLESLRREGYEPLLHCLPVGEQNKTLDTVSKIWDRLVEERFTRQSALLALGGGVVGDITGFAAAGYMRGIDFVQVPTTLLAMVDSSVGGKTGVNHPRAKNIIGAFWQPRLVFVETAFLQTLEPEEFRSGFAEVIKHGVISDEEYFRYLETEFDAIFSLDGKALAHLVCGSCKIKADVVAQDEREGGLRAILNFGHTLGHAVEALRGYKDVRHGEAVAIGMLAAMDMADRLDMLKDETATARLSKLLDRSGLPNGFKDLKVSDLLERTTSDKKVRDGKIRWVLPTRIGQVKVRDDVPDEMVRETLLAMGAQEA